MQFAASYLLDIEDRHKFAHAPTLQMPLEQRYSALTSYCILLPIFVVRVRARGHYFRFKQCFRFLGVGHVQRGASIANHERVYAQNSRGECGTGQFMKTSFGSCYF